MDNLYQKSSLIISQSIVLFKCSERNHFILYIYEYILFYFLLFIVLCFNLETI